MAFGTPPEQTPAPRQHDERGIPSRLQAGLVWVSSGVIMVITSMVVAMAIAAAMVAMGNDPEILADPDRSPIITHPTWLALGTLPAQGALVAALVGWLWLLKPDLSKVLPLRRPTAGQLLGAVLVVYGLSPAAGAVGEVVQRVLDADLTTWKAVATASKQANTAQLLLLIFALAVVPAVGEEAMFRGLITAPFLKSSKLAGILVPSVMFGLFHLEPVQAAGTIVLGIGFGLARVYTGSLIPAALAHCLNNLTVILWGRHSGGEVPETTLSPWPISVGLVLFAVGWLLLIKTRERPG